MLHPILERVREIGGVVFTGGDYNLNLIGIRAAPERAQSNRFDDSIHAIYKERGQWVDRWWRATTDPGTYWLRHPMNSAGCAALVADRQYRSCWRLGKHRGKYLALVQRGCSDVAVHRDDNADDRVDYLPDNIQIGNFGINLHRATTRSGGSVRVDRWSAGCQVIAEPGGFASLIRLCQKQTAGDRFSYTLLTEW